MFKALGSQFWQKLHFTSTLVVSGFGSNFVKAILCAGYWLELIEKEFLFQIWLYLDKWQMKPSKSFIAKQTL